MRHTERGYGPGPEQPPSGSRDPLGDKPLRVDSSSATTSRSLIGNEIQPSAPSVTLPAPAGPPRHGASYYQYVVMWSRDPGLLTSPPSARGRKGRWSTAPCPDAGAGGPVCRRPKLTVGGIEPGRALHPGKLAASRPLPGAPPDAAKPRQAQWLLARDLGQIIACALYRPALSPGE